MSFRTRKRGTPRQIGQKFPVKEKKKLPQRIGIKLPTVSVGDRLVAEKNIPIRNTELRWGEPSGLMERLHEGKYIVDKVIADEVWLADADWDKDGKITFHSSKHGHIVFKKDLLRMKQGKAGGKRGYYWIQDIGLKKGALRDYVQRRYGPEGFTAGARGRKIIKLSVLRELAKEPGTVGFRARLALKLRSFRKR